MNTVTISLEEYEKLKRDANSYHTYRNTVTRSMEELRMELEKDYNIVPITDFTDYDYRSRGKRFKLKTI
jgi:predicted N-formylglutamate amidohydrolase